MYKWFQGTSMCHSVCGAILALMIALSLILMPQLAHAQDESDLATTTIVQLAWPAHGEPWVDFLHAMAEEFEALHPGVKIEIITRSDGIETFALRLAANLPLDVVDFEPSNMGQLLDDTVFMNLRPWLRDDHVDVDSLFVPNSITSYELTSDPGVALWGMPLGLSAIVAWYNEDLLDEAALPTPHEMDQAEWNWDTLIDYGRKLTRRDGDGGIVQLGLDRFFFRPEIPIHQAGGQYYDRAVYPTSSHWNTQEVVDGISFIRQAIVEDEIALPDWEEQFYVWNGRGGISLKDGPGAIGAYYSDMDFNWDIATQPMGPANNGSWVRSDVGLQIVESSPNADIAWEWVKFLTLRPESVEAFVQKTSRLPALGSVLSEYAHHAELIPKHWQVFSEVANNPNSFFGYVVQDSRIGAVQSNYLSQVWRGEISPQSAAEQIDRELSAIFRELNE